MSGLRRWPRIVLPAALLVVGALVAVLVAGRASDYRVLLRTPDAGQLVRGNDVTIAGRPVGRVSDVRLAQDRQAEVELRIADDVAPLPRGTRATITAGGLAGRSNRTVALEPGPRAGGRTIPDGGALDPSDVRGLVDLDHVLSALDAPTRRRLARAVRRTDANLRGTGPGWNRTLEEAGPALGAVAGLAGDVAGREDEVRRLLRSADVLTGTLDRHEGDLRTGIASTARVLRTVAARRGDVDDLLARAPALVGDATRTIRASRRTIARLAPTIDAAAPLVGPLLRLADRLVDGRGALRTGLAQTAALLDAAGPVVARLPDVTPAITRGLRDARTTLRAVVAPMALIAPYVPDVLAGFSGGFVGNAGGYYDANGHYGRLGVVVGGQLVEGLPTNLLPSLLGQQGLRTGLTARCPGAGAPPAADRSNPFVPEGVDCEREHDQR